MSDSNIQYKPQVSLLLKDLPDFLKNPANYEDVQKKILNTILTSCNHSEMIDFAKCKKCTKKMLERRKLLKELGFKNAAQYMAWRRVHETIKKRFPLMDFKTNQPLI